MEQPMVVIGYSVTSALTILRFLVIAAPSQISAAGPTSQPMVVAEPDQVKAFRFAALGQAPALRASAEAVDIDANARAELDRLLDEHIKQVDAEASQIPGHNVRAHRLLARSGKLRDNFEEKTLSPWLAAHPDVREKLQRRATL